MSNAQAARVSTFDDPFDFSPEDSSDDGFLDGHETTAAVPHTVSVETMFRGVGIGAKLLPFPHEVRRSDRSRWFLVAGAALVGLALVLFCAVAISGRAPRVAVDVMFVIGLLGGGALIVTGLLKRRRARAHFLVGSAPGVDAPVDPRFVDAAAHPLVTASGDDWIVHATPRMRGALSADGQIHSLAELARDGAPSFRLPPGGRARLVCGATTFLVAAVPAPGRLARPFFRWRRPETIYTAGAAVALGLFLIVIFSVPPDPRSLSLDLLTNENHLVTFRITPPEDKMDILPLLTTPGAQSGSPGARAAGPEGKMGKKTSQQHDRAYAIKGPKDNLDPRLAQVAAELRAREAGVLGVLKKMNGPVAAVFARESALGNEAEDVLGNLMASQIGEAAGWQGLGMRGTGAQGAGTKDGLIGVGEGLKMFGHGGGPGGPGQGYGRQAGALGIRHASAPEVIPATASVRGSLDKEIIRRIVRRHINEVKYCYEQELTKLPSLAGRIVVQFMIAGNGQVLTSVLQSSTMKNARVESCTVDAVRRWSFPQPEGGGLVTVSYPFSLAPAGS